MIPIAPLEGMKALSQQRMLLSNNIQFELCPHKDDAPPVLTR
jgi:hypothetical protein